MNKFRQKMSIKNPIIPNQFNFIRFTQNCFSVSIKLLFTFKVLKSPEMKDFANMLYARTIMNCILVRLNRIINHL